jgi:tetratricopeptide (TPR) repeat protein
MYKTLQPFLFSLLLSFAFLTTMPVMGEPGNPVAPVVDEEYDRYKKRGDDYFKEGKYFEARRQYQNCLEVPGFESDAYATKRIAESTTGLELRQKVDEAMRLGQDQPVVDLLHQLLNLNPEDVLTRKQFADHYERRANQLFNQKQYLEARRNYTAAIEFADPNKKETLRIQIRTIDGLIAPKYPKRIGLKVATGVMAVGAGAMAFLLRNEYQSKVDALNQLGQSLDPNNTGVIANRDDYRRYDDAYQAAEAANNRNGVFKACLGVAAVATLAEAYLLLHKPKPRPTAWNWQPSSQSWGLAVRYTF